MLHCFIKILPILLCLLTLFSAQALYICSTPFFDAKASLSAQETASAKSKKKKNKDGNKKPGNSGGAVIVDPLKTFQITLTYNQGKKKNIEKIVTCYKGEGGVAKQVKKGLQFTSFANQLNRMEKAGRNGTKSYKNLATLRKRARAECKNPSAQSLAKYTGTFGEEEARLLYNRFAFGASPEEIQQAVAAGHEATVNKLLTWVDEPEHEAQISDLNCDTYFYHYPWKPEETDSRNRDHLAEEACNPNNSNNISLTGIRYGMLWRFARSQNAAFHKLFMFLHDESMSAAADVLSSSERYALGEHIAMIYKAVRSGDMVQYARDWNSNYLGNLIWLDGCSNKGFNPNENYAREFWELLTIGPTGLDGTPNYTSFDIAQAALAHSGWICESVQVDIPGIDNNVWFTLPFFAPPAPPGRPPYHAPGLKTIFGGTPYEAQVDTAEDLLQATIKHPAYAEYLAKDLAKEFINPDMPPIFIRSLAQLIRDKKHNLLAVVRALMLSRALFDKDNRNTLIKHPVDLLMGFIRTTGLPISPEEMNSYLRDMDQRPLLPPSVFGWNEAKLAGESYVLAWRNVMLNLMNWSAVSGWFENRNYDFHARFLSDNPSSLVVINRVAKWLNISLNDAQVAELEQYMNFDLDICQNYHVNEYKCTVGEEFARRRKFDPFKTGGDWNEKLRGLIAIMTMLPEYRLK